LSDGPAGPVDLPCLFALACAPCPCSRVALARQLGNHPVSSAFVVRNGKHQMKPSALLIAVPARALCSAEARLVGVHS
jgi:hypothetical protein